MPITNYTDIILQSQIITCEFKHRQWEEFEDTKGVIRIRKSKNRQHNDLQSIIHTNKDRPNATH